jgi:hypothetical protein
VTAEAQQGRERSAKMDAVKNQTTVSGERTSKASHDKSGRVSGQGVRWGEQTSLVVEK